MKAAPLLIVSMLLPWATWAKKADDAADRRLKGKKKDGFGEASFSELNVVTKRECELETKGDDKVEFECKAKSDDSVVKIKDKIKFKVSHDKKKGLRVKIGYKNEVDTGFNETEIETTYEIDYDRIVEYSKSESSTSPDAFDWELDTIVSEWKLDNLNGFSDVVEDENKYIFSIDDGVAFFTFTIRQGNETEDVTANTMKIDFELVNYPWAGQNTSVALLSSIESEKEIEIEQATGPGPGGRKTKDVVISFDQSLQGTGLVAFGEYTWSEEAQVLGSGDSSKIDLGNEADVSIEPMNAVQENVTIAVVATSPTDGTGRVAFSFVGDAAQGSPDIYWDPEAGIGYTNAAANSASSFVFAGSSILGGVSMLIAMLMT